jgi:hypothetical protein
VGMFTCMHVLSYFKLLCEHVSVSLFVSGVFVFVKN